MNLYSTCKMYCIYNALYVYVCNEPFCISCVDCFFCSEYLQILSQFVAKCVRLSHLPDETIWSHILQQTGTILGDLVSEKKQSDLVLTGSTLNPRIGLYIQACGQMVVARFPAQSRQKWWQMTVARRFPVQRQSWRKTNLALQLSLSSSFCCSL